MRDWRVAKRHERVDYTSMSFPAGSFREYRGSDISLDSFHEDVRRSYTMSRFIEVVMKHRRNRDSRTRFNVAQNVDFALSDIRLSKLGASLTV